MDPALAWSIIELAPDAILLVRADGRIDAANHRAGELFGFGNDELTGLNVDVLVPAAVRTLHAAHRTAYAHEPRARGMGGGRDLTAARKDGSTFPVEVALGPITLGDGDAVVAIVRDITERIEARRRISEIQQTLDASQEAVFLFDADSLRFDYVNQGAADQVGYSTDELLDMSPLDLNPTMGDRDFRALLQPLLSGQLPTRTVATRHRHRDGSEVEVECVLQCAPAHHHDDRRTIVAFCRDVTERLETERQLRATEQELHVLEDRERIARDLHDTVIQRLFAAGMTLQVAAARAEEATSDRIRIVVDELDETIRDIRQAIFRLTAHNLEPASVRRQIVEVVEEEQGALGVEPELRFSGPIEAIDPDHVGHLLATLREALSNVARHAQARAVEVEIGVTGDHVVLVVSDDGVGVGAGPSEGDGLRNMADRADQLGGVLTIGPGAGRGTRVEWRVPATPAG